MANKKNKLIHAHSLIAHKNPKPEDLAYGEIAVNNNEEGEFIAIKSTSTDKSIARISADRVIMDWVDKKQVFPISGSVITTGETGPELEIELNQVVSNLSPKSGEVMKGGNENPGKFRIDLSPLAALTKDAEFANLSATTLYISGDATVIENISYGSSSQISDKNLKDNIKDIDNESVEKVKGVVLKTFNYKSDASKRKMYGAIAQDVENAGLNELVYTDDKGVKSLDYTGLLLLKIAELENRIKELEKK